MVLIVIGFVLVLIAIVGFVTNLAGGGQVPLVGFLVLEAISIPIVILPGSRPHRPRGVDPETLSRRSWWTIAFFLCWYTSCCDGYRHRPAVCRPLALYTCEP